MSKIRKIIFAKDGKDFSVVVVKDDDRRFLVAEDDSAVQHAEQGWESMIDALENADLIPTGITGGTKKKKAATRAEPTASAKKKAKARHSAPRDDNDE